VLGAVAALPILGYVVVALQRIGYPYELTYFEGSTVEVTARVVEGDPLYGPPSTSFTPWPYPPLYFWLTGAVARLLGVNLLSLRLVSFAASIAVLVLLALVVRKVGGRTVAGLVAAGVYAATYRVSGAWADTARVDSLVLALLLGAVLAGIGAHTWRRGAVVGALFFLAFLTKQTALLVAAPPLLWMLFRRRTAGVAACSVLGGGLALSTGIGVLVTDGWYWRQVIKQLPGQSLAPRWLWDFWLRDLLLPFAITVLTVVVTVLVVRRRRGRSAASGWPRNGSSAGGDVAFLVAAVIGLVLASWVARLHEGGYANVAMPAHAGLAVVFGLLLASALSAPWCGTLLTVVFAVALAVQSGLMTLWQFDVIPSAADRVAGDRFVRELRALPGVVLVPTHPYYLRLADRPPHASAIAVHDLLRSNGGRAAMGEELPWDLDGVSAVVLDNPDDASLFGNGLSRDFTLVTPTFVPPGVFLPVTDLPTHPTLLYLRTRATSGQ
jgi:hypothetical protein